MGVIEVCHEYEVAGIWVSADLAPALSDIPPGSRPRLIIPGWAPDPGAPVPNERYFNMSLGCHSYMEDGSAYEIRQFVIAIPIELDVPEDYMERWGADHFSELRSHRDATQPRAEALARAFVDWVRTEGAQPRLGRFEDGSVAYGGCSFVQAVGERLRTASARALVGHGTTGPPLAAAATSSFFARALRGDSPALAAVLYADALHDYDIRRQVLLAAISVEVEIKTLLQDAAAQNQIDLLNLLIPKGRQGASTASLLDGGARAVLGRSLKSDDSALYAALKRLLQSRNIVAHGAGEELDAPDLLRHQIDAAGRVLPWCAERRASHTSE